MKKFFIALLTLFFMTGCFWDEPKPCHEKVITKNIYLPCEVDSSIKPIGQDINWKIFEVNQEVYYVVPEKEAFKLGVQWDGYKTWCENNYEILKGLDNNETDK